MTVPTIHLNGSSKESLIEALITAGNAILHAEHVMLDVTPNARDYYPLGNNAFQDATTDHVARVKKLQSVRFELMALASAILGE